MFLSICVFIFLSFCFPSFFPYVTNLFVRACTQCTSTASHVVSCSYPLHRHSADLHLSVTCFRGCSGFCPSHLAEGDRRTIRMFLPFLLRLRFLISPSHLYLSLSPSQPRFPLLTSSLFSFLVPSSYLQTRILLFSLSTPLPSPIPSFFLPPLHHHSSSSI